MREAEKTDHEVDMEFGQWLRDQRTKSGLTIEQASERSGVQAERLKSLELGYAKKGVTAQESQKVAAAYRINIQEFLDKAMGKEQS